MNKEEIMNKIQLYEFCENMEELYDDYYVPLQQENKQLKDNWNKLKDYIGLELEIKAPNGLVIPYLNISKKMQELEKGENNENN